MLGVESACGINQQVISVAGLGCGNCIMSDRGGIGTVIAGDNLNVEFLTPKLDLFDGCGPEGVASGEQDSVLFILERVRKLRAGGGLAGAIYPNDRDDGDSI